MFDRFLSRGRVRSAAKRVATEPTIENYLRLAQTHAAAGQLGDVRKVCDEGLEFFPGNSELARLKGRAEALQREDRVRELHRLIKVSPRPALWQELCEVELAAGRLARAETAATDWHEATGDSQAVFQRARTRAERFFADRRRDDARMSLDLLEAYCRSVPGDEKALRLGLTIYTRCGAWGEARTALARLLELLPGDPTLEARFRTVASLAENNKSLDQALREVERTGRFVDDDLETERAGAAQDLRPMLQEIAAEPGVNGAFYVRGGTALVQGPRGATAERYARGVRDLVTCGRAAARRLGIGQPLDIQLEGNFGAISIRPAAVGAAALWTAELPNQHTENLLATLAGGDRTQNEVEA